MRKSGGRTSKKGSFYYALNHPLRREIISLLGSRGSLSSTELKRLLKIGPGKLYYHLDILRGLVEQDENKKYKLSDKGLKAYEMLVSSGAVSGGRPTWISRSEDFISFLSNQFLRYGGFLKGILTAAIITFLGGLLSYLSGLSLILIFYVGGSPPIHMSLISFLVSWLAIYVVAEAFSRVMLHREEGAFDLFVGSAVAITPMTIYPVFLILDKEFGLGLGDVFGGWALKSVLLVMQGLTLVILTIIISRVKNVPADKASLISLITAYIGIAVYLFLVGI